MIRQTSYVKSGMQDRNHAPCLCEAYLLRLAGQGHGLASGMADSVPGIRRIYGWSIGFGQSAD